MDVQQLFKNLKKEAECPLCLETVKEPKTLPCLHSFCLRCLDKHAGYARRQLQTTIKCPVCLTHFEIPEGDTFSDLPASFHLNRLVDILALKDGGAETQTCNSCDDNNAVTSYCFVCQSFLCAACFEAHQRLKATRGHRNVLIEKLQAQDVEELIHRPVMCTQKYHENEALDYYCQDCEACICMKCGFVSHNRHTMVDIQEAAEGRKIQITEAIEKAKAEVVVVERKIKKQIELMEKSTDEMLAAQSKITAIVDEFVRILREHEAAMKTKLSRFNEAQQRDHATQTEMFQLVVFHLNGFVERGKGILQRNIPSEIIQTEQTVISRLEELLNASQAKIYKPLHFSYVANETIRDVMTVLKHSGPGQVVASLTDPARSVADCEHVGTVEPSSTVVFKVTTRDSDGNQLYNEEDKVTVQIRSPTGEEEEKEIENFQDGNYNISVKPKLVGHHDVVIEINGLPLTRKVQITPHYYKAHSQQFDLQGKVNFNFPCSIAQSEKTGNIAVANYGNKTVLLFDAGLKYLRTVVDFSPNQQPRCVAFTKFFDVIIVAEKSSKFGTISSNISVYTEDGKFVKHISERLLINPCSVSVRTDGKIIVCDSGDLSVKVLSADGAKMLKSFRVPNYDAFPWFAVYHEERYFVSYRMGHSVKVFNEEGLHLYDVGQFVAPAGLAIDKFHNLIVCDAADESRCRIDSNVKVFTLVGELVYQLTSGTPISKCFCSVAVTQNGDVLVSDVKSNSIRVFR